MNLGSRRLTLDHGGVHRSDAATEEIVTMNAFTKAIVPRIFGAVASATLAASAGEPEPVQPDTRPAAALRQVVLPGTGFVVEPGTSTSGRNPRIQDGCS
jgi:hypothetical protein